MISNPVLLLTGANRGLGRVMAEAFAKKGYAIGINYLKGEDAARETSDSLKKHGIPTRLLKADVRSSKAVDGMVKDVVSEWGRIDVLINNAGIARNSILHKMSDEDWQDVLDVHLTGAFYCCRAVLPVMRKNKVGSILNMSSYLAKRPAVGVANYAAAKSALISLTQSLALEVGSHGIRVNAILPGFHVTDMNADVWEKHKEAIQKQHILGAMPCREDMAEFVYMVAHLKTVTGQIFPFESRLL